MKLIMAVSKDGWLARKANDDMSWLGQNDKAIFRALTATGGAPLAVGLTSAKLMPLPLAGRSILSLSSCPTSTGADCTLSEYYIKYSDGWLLGGPTLARTAIKANRISEVHLCRSERYAFPAYGYGAIQDDISLLIVYHGFKKVLTTKIGDVTVECWKRNEANAQ